MDQRERQERNEYRQEQFEKDLAKLGIALEDRQMGQFMGYYELLMDWNRRMNLTAITEYDEVMKKHFIDSLSLIRACPQLQDPDQPLRLIDVGTGAGFPGLPLKIVFPHLKLTLLDSLNKRILFLRAVIQELGLSEVEAVHGRAEDLAFEAGRREQYDLCVSRAVAKLSTLSEYCLPFVKTGGLFVSYKSEKLLEEKEKAKKAIYLLGGETVKQVEFFLPDTDIYRNLFVIRKVRTTPRKYPRKAGLPSKEPLL